MNYIQEYQTFKGLVPDGILGSKTLRKLEEDLDIKDVFSFSHFLGQTHHESNGFSVGRENLNYSSEGLIKYFHKYFKDNEYFKYSRNPILIGNRVYANRMGNGPEDSGDGYRYRGVGPIQLTGKNNIQDYFKSVNIDISTSPDIILKPEHYFRSAKYFFDKNSIWQYTKDLSEDSLIKVSKFINLGNPNSKYTPIGLEDREELTLKYYKILAKSSR